MLTYRASHLYGVIDKEDEHLLEVPWTLSRDGYATSVRYGHMHTHLCPGSDNYTVVDHINKDKLDNRKKNLRLTNKQQNMLNRPPVIVKRRHSYSVSVTLAYCDTLEEAKEMQRRCWNSALRASEPEIKIPKRVFIDADGVAAADLRHKLLTERPKTSVSHCRQALAIISERGERFPSFTALGKSGSQKIGEVIAYGKLYRGVRWFIDGERVDRVALYAWEQRVRIFVEDYIKG